MPEYDANKIKHILRTILLYVVNGSCLGFVIWQTMSCTTKYIHKPTKDIKGIHRPTKDIHKPTKDIKDIHIMYIHKL